MLMGITPKELAFTLYKIPDANKYTSFCINKKNGGTRNILAPCDQLKWLQQKLLELLYDCEDDYQTIRSSNTQFGFRRNCNIFENASRHTGRRHLLNLDLQDFFDHINFGRVRGFFISDKRFALHKNVATTIAQIACFNNGLPQGSPCSPHIASLVSSFLDVRLIRFLRPRRCSYSRYADDITISTNLKIFPSDVAIPLIGDPHGWTTAPEISDIIVRAGFSLNPLKTRFSVRHSRQMVTGLVVNQRPNVPREFYLATRAMCDSYFKFGSSTAPKITEGFGRPCPTESDKKIDKNANPLQVLEGRLSYIHHIRELTDQRSIQQKQDSPTQFWSTLQHFYLFKNFMAHDAPVILTEGPSDVFYIKSAISQTKLFLPNLIDPLSGKSGLARFFRFDGLAAKVLGVTGGSGNIKRLLYLYSKGFKRYNMTLRRNPIVIVIDNDSGGSDVIAMVNKIYGTSILTNDPQILHKVTDFVYLVKTPHVGAKTNTCIEDLLPKSVVSVKLNGKSFFGGKKIDPAKQFGKVALSQYVQANSGAIDFTGLEPILDAINSAISSVITPPPASPATAPNTCP